MYPHYYDFWPDDQPDPWDRNRFRVERFEPFNDPGGNGHAIYYGSTVSLVWDDGDAHICIVGAIA